jgi:hypothetical protein
MRIIFFLLILTSHLFADIKQIKILGNEAVIKESNALLAEIRQDIPKKYKVSYTGCEYNNSNIFTATAQAYVLYSMSSQTSMGNPGCFLYVGGTGSVSVVTIGGDVITFTGVPAGTTLPIQVLKLRATGTTATQVNAMW